MTDTFPVPFGRYQLVERLAVGGMAELFKARVVGSHGFQKPVVIKKILPHLAADASFVAMFIDEAKITARLDHPKIAQVLELGTMEEQLYIAMEFVDGLDALAVLRACAHKKQTLPAPIAVHIAHEVLDALDYAHSALDDDGKPLGIVHRDISPSNVLISRRGDVKLADFGIAHAVERQQKTQAGTLKGKYGYMSPEQVIGADIDCRSDLFSVGIVLAEMLMGRRLFTAPNELDVLLMVRDVRLERLDKYGVGVDPELRELMNKAFTRDPKTRYQSAREFRDALAEYLFVKRQRVQPRDLSTLVETLLSSENAKPVVAPPGEGSTSGPRMRPNTATLVGPATKAKEIQAAEAARLGREHAAAKAQATPAPTPAPRLPDNDATPRTPKPEPPPPERLPRAATTPLRPPDATPRATARQTMLPPPPAGLAAATARQTQPPTPKPGPGAPAVSAVGTPGGGPSPSVRRPAAPPAPTPALGELHNMDADIDAQIDAALASIAPMEMASTASTPISGDGRASTEIPIILDLSDNAPQIPHDNVPQSLGEGPELSGPTVTVVPSKSDTDFSDLSLDLELDNRAAARLAPPDAPPEAAPPPPKPSPTTKAGEAPDEEGDLATTPAIRTLYRLAVEKSSGLLVVEAGNAAAGGIVKEIFFAAGAPEYVSSNVARELLGEYLVSQKVISAGELAMALAMMPHFGGKLGDTLVGLGLMKPLDVFRHLTRQVRDKIIDVCTWQKGHYRWFRGKRNAREAFPLGLDAFEVLGAGATALPFEAVEHWAEGFLAQTPVAAKNPRVVPEAFRLGAYPRDVYNRLDGRMNLGGFLQRFTNVDDRIAFLRTLYLLVQSDLAFWQ